MQGRTGDLPREAKMDDRGGNYPAVRFTGPDPTPSPRRSGLHPLPLTVGHAELRDLPDLLRLPGIELLNQPESLLVPFSPVRAALRARVRWPRVRRRVLVARTGDRVVGFAMFQPQRPDQRWRLDAIGAAVGVLDAIPVIDELIRYGITLAGVNGVKRLYARVPHGAFCATGLRDVGFWPYASETVLVGSDFGRAPRMPATVRRQQPSDTWAVQQLYSASVPRQVEYAEALTSQRWDVADNQASVGVHGLVIEEGHHIVAMARIVSRTTGHTVELIVLPERTELIDALLDGVAAWLIERRSVRVYASIRGYQQEIQTKLERRGLVPLHEQDLMIKYTTANIRLPVFEVVPAFAEVREGVPQRVPTFLQTQPHDDAVT